MGFPLSVPHVSPLEWPKWRMGPTLQGLPLRAPERATHFNAGTDLHSLNPEGGILLIKWLVVGCPSSSEDRHWPAL
mgnify:CR=1 FL=1